MFDLFRLNAAALIALMGSSAVAADIAGSCLVSFSVKDKTFVSGTTTMSCVALERRRVSLFSAINALPTSGNASGADLASRLAKVEDQLKKLESEMNWTGFTANISGNFLAALGLSACLKSSRVGCGVAVVGKVLSLVSVVDGAASDAQKANVTANIRQEINSIRQEIVTLTPPAEKLRNQLVADFNNLCVDVKRYCLSE